MSTTLRDDREGVEKALNSTAESFSALLSCTEDLSSSFAELQSVKQKLRAFRHAKKDHEVELKQAEREAKQIASNKRHNTRRISDWITRLNQAVDELRGE